MKQVQTTPRVRLLPKASLQIPVAEEPPVPVISPEKALKVKPPAKGKGVVFREKQRRKELMVQAEVFSQQTPGLNTQMAYEILLGQYTLEEWQARRQASRAKRQTYLERRRAKESDARSEEEKAWCFPFMDALEREPVWLETAKGQELGRVIQSRVFLMVVQKINGKHWGYKKTELSALCSARLSPQILQMRQILPEAQRGAIPAEKPKDRWPFPESLVTSWVGQRVQVQLLNGSVWTGYLRWNSRFTLLLGEQPVGESEVLLYKHACCNIQIAPSLP